MPISVEAVLAIVFGILGLAVAAAGVYVAHKTGLQRTPSSSRSRADVEHEGATCQRPDRTETDAISLPDRVATHNTLAIQQSAPIMCKYPR